MQLSHEMYYQSLYVQGKGELRKELVKCLGYSHILCHSPGITQKVRSRYQHGDELGASPGGEKIISCLRTEKEI